MNNLKKEGIVLLVTFIAVFSIIIGYSDGRSDIKKNTAKTFLIKE